MCSIDADADAERAEILVAVGFEFRLIEDLLQSLSCEFIPFTGLRFEIAAAFRFPALLLGGLQFPAFFGIADELGGMQSLDGCLNFSSAAWFAHFIDQERGDVAFSARQVTNEFQKTDGLGDSQCPALIFGIFLEPLADLVNVSAFLIRQVAFD